MLAMSKQNVLIFSAALALAGCVSDTGSTTRPQGSARAEYVDCMTAYVDLQRSAGRPASLAEGHSERWCGVEEARYRVFIKRQASGVSASGQEQTADAAMAAAWEAINQG